MILNRPEKMNVMDELFFKEIGQVFTQMSFDRAVKVILLASEGKVFTAGLDLKSTVIGNTPDGNQSHAEKSLNIFRHVGTLQQNFKSILDCRKPVIACAHSKVIGGGIDLLSFCDVRLCSKEATFSIKETKIGIVADLGTLQRIQKITSQGFAREMAFTGEEFNSQQAYHSGFVNAVYDTKEEMLEKAYEKAMKMAENSPLVVAGTKLSLNYALDHSLEDSLNQVALWNSAFLQSDDLMEAFSAFLSKRKPSFKNYL